MAISLDIFVSRLNHICEEYEEGVETICASFAAETTALENAVADAEPEVLLAIKAITDARIQQMSDRLDKFLGA